MNEHRIKVEKDARTLYVHVSGDGTERTQTQQCSATSGRRDSRWTAGQSAVCKDFPSTAYLLRTTGTSQYHEGQTNLDDFLKTHLL